MHPLSPERWQEVSPYLDQVLSLPEDERASWLESFRTERPDLANLLQDLLKEHRALARGQFLERSPVSGAAESFLIGRKIQNAAVDRTNQVIGYESFCFLRIDQNFREYKIRHPSVSFPPRSCE
jgi:hypothetical protein